MNDKAKRAFLPCGHTPEQGAWLGCDEEGCRKTDEMISRQYQAEERGDLPRQRAMPQERR